MQLPGPDLPETAAFEQHSEHTETISSIYLRLPWWIYYCVISALTLVSLVCFWVMLQTIIAEKPHGMRMASQLLNYLAPSGFAGLLVFYLLKIKYYHTANKRSGLTLEREAAPALWAAIERLAELAEVSRPVQLTVDHETFTTLDCLKIDASRISIGLPLMQCMNRTSWYALVFSEMARFGRCAGIDPRLSQDYLLFYRMAYEPISFDLQIEDRLLRGKARWLALWYLAFLLSKCAHYLLRSMIRPRQLQICAIQRNSVRQADERAIRLCGVDAFKKALQFQLHLQIASRALVRDIAFIQNEERLHPLLSRQLREIVATIDARHRKLLANKTSIPSTGFETAPSLGERLTFADHCTAHTPLFADDSPAASLLPDADRLEQAVSEIYYRKYLSSQLPSAEKMSTTLALEPTTEDLSALQHYELKALPPFRAISLPGDVRELPISTSLANYWERRTMLREEQQRLRANYLEQFEQFIELSDKLTRLYEVESLLPTGETIAPEDFELSAEEIERPMAARQKTFEAITKCQNQMQPFEHSVGAHIQWSLGLLYSPVKLPSDIKEKWHASLVHLLNVCHKLEKLMPQLWSLYLNAGALERLYTYEYYALNREYLMRAIRSQSSLLRSDLQQLDQGLKKTAYKFPGTQHEQRLSLYAMKRVPQSGELELCRLVGSAAKNRLFPVYTKAFCSVLQIALEIEKSVDHA